MYYSETSSNQYERTPAEGKVTSVVMTDTMAMRNARQNLGAPYGNQNADVIPKGALVFAKKNTLTARTNAGKTLVTATAPTVLMNNTPNAETNIDAYNKKFKEEYVILGTAVHDVLGSRVDSPASTPTSITIQNAGSFDYPAVVDVHAGQSMEARWLKPTEYHEQRYKFLGPFPVLQLFPVAETKTYPLYAPGPDVFSTTDSELHKILKEFAVASRAQDPNPLFNDGANGTFQIGRPLAQYASDLCEHLVRRRIDTTPTLKIKCVKGAPAGFPAKFVMH